VNLDDMRAFAEARPDRSIVQQAAAQLPWFHNCVILDRIKNQAERLWYIQAAIEHGWSRNVLVIQIEAGLYRRQGKAITNFTKALPAPQSDLAQQLLKDPYNFDFLMLPAGSSLLSPEASLLCGDRPEERAVPTGIRRQDELLPCRSR
jgi:predicted nuclease of restriction endonuclease-like (RecB) superfamily